MSEKTERSLSYSKRRALRRRKLFIRRFVLFCLIVISAAAGVFAGSELYACFYSSAKSTNTNSEAESAGKVKKAEELAMPDWVTVDLIHKHGNARSGTKLSGINNIVIHYVGNPGTTAKNNRDFFDKENTDVSSNFVVGLDGEIIQCLPVYEKSAASNWRNSDTISIEVCHEDEDGKFNSQTYASVVKLTAWLCKEFDLKSSDVIRHYDITGKMCPVYYVNNKDAWKTFLKDVEKGINDYGTQQ